MYVPFLTGCNSLRQTESETVKNIRDAIQEDIAAVEQESEAGEGRVQQQLRFQN